MGVPAFGALLLSIVGWKVSTSMAPKTGMRPLIVEAAGDQDREQHQQQQRNAPATAARRLAVDAQRSQVVFQFPHR